MKRTPLRRKGKSDISKLKAKLWKVFADYIKKRDKGICFTCGAKAEGHNYHAGHFIPKSVGGIALYFHEDNVHGQCARCNIWLSGNQYIYGQRLGEEKCKELYRLKEQINKWGEKEYLEALIKYETKLQEL